MPHGTKCDIFGCLNDFKKENAVNLLIRDKERTVLVCDEHMEMLDPGRRDFYDIDLTYRGDVEVRPRPAITDNEE